MSRQRSRSQRFVPLVTLAKDREQAAAIALGTCNRKMQQSLQQLELLKQYRHEYTQQLMQGGNVGMDAAMLKTYKNFIAGLDQAIKNQHVELSHSQQQYQQQKQQWLQTHQKTRVMEVTVERFAREETRTRDRREQHELDDRNNQNHNNQHGKKPTPLK